MRILQLGNGGGLNPLQTNSSFLIDIGIKDKPEYILFDCGFNIMERLIKGEEKGEFLIKDIRMVYISHNDDDHIGNLQTFIYWQYFKNNIIVDVFSGSNILPDFDMNYLMVGGLMEKTKLINIFIKHPFSQFGVTCGASFQKDHEVFFYMIKAYHGNRACNGLVIAKKDEIIFISGDTKANQNIEKDIKNILKYWEIEKLCPKPKTLFFHDYSNWNAPSKNVHACEGDFTIEYSKEFQDKCIKYHTGSEDFIKDWRTL